MRAGDPRGVGRRKVAIVLPVHWSALMGGAQYQAKLLVDRLTSAYAADVRYFTLRADPAFVPDGYTIERIARPGGRHRYGHFFDALPLYRALARFAPDIIYQQVGCAHTGIAACYARRHGAKMFWRVSSDKSTGALRAPAWHIHRVIEQAWLAYGIRRADVILAQTRLQKTQLARRYGRDDAIVLPSFHPHPSERIVKEDGDKTVLWVANVKPVKNAIAFVRLAQSFAGRRDVTFVMVGRMMLRGRPHDELIRALAAAPNVRFLGALAQDEVNALLAAGHVLVNTSRHEGFSNAFIQAWMRRVPVVSLNVDPDALLSRGALGFVSGTEGQLYRDVERLLDDGSLRERLGERCREHAMRRHSIANIDEVAGLMGLRRLTEPAEPSLPLLAHV